MSNKVALNDNSSDRTLVKKISLKKTCNDILKCCLKYEQTLDKQRQDKINKHETENNKLVKNITDKTPSK